MTLYGALLRLYPRSFRDAYGQDMALLLRDQLRDERAARVWGRTLLDLVLTVPPQHLEVLVSRPVSAAALYSGLGGAALLVAGVTLVTVGLSVPSLVVAAVLGSLGALAWRRSHALSGPRSRGHRGVAHLAAGGVGLAVTLLSVRGAGELAAGPWVVFALALLTSVGLLVVGLALLVHRSPGHRSA